MKKRIINGLIIFIVILSISTITAYATSTYLYNSEDVSYDHGTNSIESDNVQGAIDELYEHATDYTEIRSMIYPVGSIYISVTDDTVAKVEARFGGTWEAFGAGRTIVGVGTGTDANSTNKTFAINEIDGEYTHQLTTTEMPSHAHSIGVQAYGSITGYSSGGAFLGSANNTVLRDSRTAGGNGYHNNIQPYITVYMYKRTA